MKWLAAAMCLCSAMALADDKKGGGASADAMKDMVKDAAGGDSGKEKDPNAPDVEKMPFTAESVKKVVGYYQPKIQGCYEEILASKGKNPVEGKVMTAWVVTPDGMVKAAKVDSKKSSLKDSKLHDCVVTVLSTMEFPKPADGKDHPIEFPFNLKAVH
jgi:hypothetical protein